MRKRSALEVSVLLPFGDDEDRIGSSVRRLAAHLRELELGFEILAVDEDSGDNSHTVLGLLRSEIPELQVAEAPGPGRGWDVGASQARGRVLWLISPRSAKSTLAPFGRAYRRITRRELDLVVVERRFAVCHRTRSLPLLQGQRSTGLRRLGRRAQSRGLAVESYAVGGSGTGAGFGERPWARLVAALTPARSLPGAPRAGRAAAGESGRYS